MEDRYLYRAKRIDNGEWMEGSLMMDIHKNVETNEESEIFGIYPNGRDYVKVVDPSTICQCTGLKDKNGKLIFENDIVTVPRDEDTCVITWDKDCGKWSINQYAAYMYDFDNFWSVELEVIGNIFNNPELLEVGE